MIGFQDVRTSFVAAIAGPQDGPPAQPARHTTPELQHLAAGDVVPMSPDGYAVAEIADTWMIRTMLLDIRERAERLPGVAGPTS
jgi:hypothetical protein